MPPFPSSSAPTHISATQTRLQTTGEEEEDNQSRLPPELVQILDRALHTLRTTFAEKPPHTVQRLCELVLYPKKHYRTLPAYLRGLDRVVSVSSTLDIFPLDIPPPTTNGLRDDAGALLFPNTNGYNRADDLGSDESLGGALLTPIPWLKHNSQSPGSGSVNSSSLSKVSSWQDAASDPDDDFLSEDLSSAEPDSVTQDAIEDATAIEEVAAEHRSDGSIPDRPNHAVTQGELLRLEQEAGVVPVPVEDISLPEGMLPESQGGPKAHNDDGDNMPDSVPHARGPDLVGTVDMGLVGGQERNVHINHSSDRERVGVTEVSNAQDVLSGGSAAQQRSDTSPNSGSGSGESDDFVHVTGSESAAKKDEDGDIVLVDVDGMEETSSTSTKTNLERESPEKPASESAKDSGK